MTLVWTKPEAPARPTRRDQLLSTSASLFAARGFAGVTTDDIGAALGISGPALYHHFKSKEALLGEMLVSISEYLLAKGESIVAEVDSPLTGLVGHHADFAVDNVDLITVHYRDLVHAPDADQARVRRLQRRYAELWINAVDEPDRRRAAVRVHAAFGLMNSTPHSMRLGRDDMKELLVEMACSVLTIN